jgi:DNA repair protein RecO (recombination protein O)
MRTKAFIIKGQNTREHDRLITCYTSDFGKLTAVAKSILKNTSLQKMHLDTMNLVEFELINGRAIPIIAAAQCERTFLGIKKSLSSLAMAYFFLEVLEKSVFDQQKDEDVWNFLSEIFDELDRENVTLARFREMQEEFLEILGYAQPKLSKDANMSSFSQIDAQFERSMDAHFVSLPFLYSVI